MVAKITVYGGKCIVIKGGGERMRGVSYFVILDNMEALTWAIGSVLTSVDVEIGEKYYFGNLGIRNCLWGYRLEYRGKIMQNLVYNHLVFKGYKVMVGALGTKEIDFIAEKEGVKLKVRVAINLND